MNAIISGCAGLALINEGGKYFAAHVDSPDLFKPVEFIHPAWFFSGATDLVSHNFKDRKEASRELVAAYDFQCAFQLTLVCLDKDDDDEEERQIRTDSMNALEDILKDKETAKRLRKLLLSRPVPKEGDLSGALKIAEDKNFPLCLELFHEMEDPGGSIETVNDAWEAIPDNHFENYDKRHVFLKCSVRLGLFSELQKNIGNNAKLGEFVVTWSQAPEFEDFSNIMQILQQWISPLKYEQAAKDYAKLKAEDKSHKAKSKEDSDSTQKYNSKEVLEKVEKMKNLIVDLWSKRNYLKAEKILNELIDFQKIHGGHKFTVMSLCSLAVQAKNMEIPLNIPLKLTKTCIELKPDDGWSWAERGHALLNVNRFEEALEAYRKAEEYGQNEVGKTGQAQAYMKLGKLQQALSLYSEAILECSDNEVAKNGRAEVFKAMGRYPEALDAYEKTIKQYPENVVAKNGKGEVLKAMGEYQKALDAYEKTIKQHSDDVVAKNGKAEVLKSMGEYQKALIAYEETIKLHPEDFVAKHGKAEVLKAMGEYQIALDAYGDTIEQHPEDVIAKTGRAEVLKAMGEHQRALDAYEDTIKQHPENVIAKTGWAEALKAMGEYQKALDAHEDTIRQHPENVIAKNGRAEVLKAMGEYQIALDVYEDTIKQHPENVIAKTGMAEVLKAMGEYQKSLIVYEDTIKQHPENVIAKTGKISILIKMKRYDEAWKMMPEKDTKKIDSQFRLHMKGMIYYKQGKFEKAVEIFEKGISIPYGQNISSFKSALAMTQVKLKQGEKAVKTLAEDNTPKAELVKLCVCGKLNKEECAIKSYDSLREKPVPGFDDLRDNAAKKYIFKEETDVDDQWFEDRIEDLLIAA